jgi:hypothetical protein
MIFTLIIAAFVGGCALGVFMTLVAGIHSEERRAVNAHRSELAARQVMGVCVRKPGADKARR